MFILKDILNLYSMLYVKLHVICDMFVHNCPSTSRYPLIVNERVEYQLEFSFCFLLLSQHFLVIVIVISLRKCIYLMCVTKNE